MYVVFDTFPFFELPLFSTSSFAKGSPRPASGPLPLASRGSPIPLDRPEPFGPLTLTAFWICPMRSPRYWPCATTPSVMSRSGSPGASRGWSIRPSVLSVVRGLLALFNSPCNRSCCILFCAASTIPFNSIAHDMDSACADCLMMPISAGPKTSCTGGIQTGDVPTDAPTLPSKPTPFATPLDEQQPHQKILVRQREHQPAVVRQHDHRLIREPSLLHLRTRRDDGGRR